MVIFVRVLFGETRKDRERERGSRSQQPAQLRPRVWFASAHWRGTGTAETPRRQRGEKARGGGEKAAAGERDGKKIREEEREKEILFDFIY